MASEFVLSLNEKEKAFIEQYQDLYIKHNGKEEIINAVLPFVVQNVDNHENLIKIIYDEIKKKLFCEKYKKEYFPTFVIKNDFLKFINEKDIDFSVKQIQFSFPSVSIYSNIKYRNNYLLSSGNDGIIRIWQFDKNKEQFFLFGEYGEKQTTESQFDLLNEYLFYSKDKSLIVYHIFSKKIVTTENLSNKIEDILLKDDKIFIYSNNISSGYVIENNKLFVKTVDKYDSTEYKEKSVKINDKKVVFVKDDKIYLTENEIKEITKDLEVNCLKTTQATNWATTVAITPDGKNIVSSKKILDFNGNCLKTLIGHSGYVNSIAITPDGKNIVSGSSDCSIKIWDFNGNCLKTFENNTNVYSVAITPDGKNIISGGDNQTMSGMDKTIKIWDFNGNCLKTFEGHKSSVMSAAITSNGKNIISGSTDYTIKIWDFNGNCLKTFEGHANVVYSVVITPNNKNIISGSRDNIIKIWDFAGNCLKTFENYATTITITPDGKNIISGSYDNTIKIWDFNGNCLKTLTGHTSPIFSIAITSDGKNIVSSDTIGVIKIWEIKRFDFKPSEILSDNLVLPIYGIQKIDNYLIIYYKNGNVLRFDKEGNLKEKITIKSENNSNLIFTGLKQPKINFYPLENDFIIEKDGFYYGSKNYKDYLYFIENDKVCLFDEGYDYYDLITNKNLFNEI